MYSPTHIEVTILRARGLLTKGKNGTNNCFVTIGMDKEKYQTSVKDKAEPNVTWEEACELKIPDQGNRAELVLTCLHRNNLGLDEFLGQVTLPLNAMDVDRPRQKWFKLESKPGKEKKSKERGEIEARINFIVKSSSLSDLSKKEKHKASIGQLASSVGGSLASISQIGKRKTIKKFAESLGSKMHLSSKKKNKDGDDGSSFSGSLASIGTPTSSNGLGGRSNRGQHAGDADPGVISEDEDEFVFDNLSHKSSASSINVSRPSFVPKQSPLMINGGKEFSKREFDQQADIIDPELEQIENDFSIRARTLPPPSKPPRTPYQNLGDSSIDKPLDEWESKLYGNHLEVGSVNSLKRRSWENNRVPLPAPTADGYKEAEVEKVEEVDKNTEIKQIPTSSSTSSEEEEEEEEKREEEKSVERNKSFSEVLAKFETSQDFKVAPPVAPRVHLNTQSANIPDSEPVFKSESKLPPLMLPRALVRNREQKEEQKAEKVENDELKQSDHDKQKVFAEQNKLKEKEEEEKKRQKMEFEQKQKDLEDKRIKLEEEQNRQKMEKEKKKELDEKERRENKRREEDQRLLSFAKRSISGESDVNSTTTPEQSPKERSAEKRDKRLSKFKYFGNKRDKNGIDNSSSSPTSGERIIIGHEKSMTHAEKRSEISAALSKKYDGKSREELMLIANGMENEALLQRQRVKELEDYLDNLLLRVMETHPKILQNPYSRTTSAKSG